MGVKLPDFMPNMPMLYSFRTYLLSRPTVESHEVLSVFLQKHQFLAAILLSNDVEVFPAHLKRLKTTRVLFPRVDRYIMLYVYGFIT